MIYLASPFSHPDRQVEFTRYHQALIFTHEQLALGKIVFSPIVYCYPIAANFGLRGDFETWRVFNESMIERAEALWVLRLKGWQESKGVQAEIAYAKRCEVPVHFRMHV